MVGCCTRRAGGTETSGEKDSDVKELVDSGSCRVKDVKLLLLLSLQGSAASGGCRVSLGKHQNCSDVLLIALVNSRRCRTVLVGCLFQMFKERLLIRVFETQLGASPRKVTKDHFV